MKYVIAVWIIILLCPNSIFAQCGPPPIGYIGLYADDSHSSCCVTGIGFYPVEMWIWFLPGVNGMICVEFAISYPENVIRSTVIQHPSISVVLGDLETGISACYPDCQTDWIWQYHQLLYVTDSTPSWIEIIPHPEAYGYVNVAPCTPGY